MTLFDINKAEAASRAVELYRDQRPTRHNPKLTLRQCAERCNAHYSLVRKYNARYQKGQRIPGFQRAGRQPTLSDQEDDALIQFVKLVDRGLFPLTSAALISYGDYLRAKRAVPPPMPLTYRWAIKWRRDNPQFTEASMKYSDGYRMAAVMDFEGVKDWFRKYAAILETFRIKPEDLWNFDESPFFVGVLDGGLTVFVVRNKKKRPRVMFSPGDRESLKSIDCISAAGDSIPPFLVFRADGLVDDFETTSVEDDAVVTKTDASCYNAENALEWLRHFNRYSFEKSPSFEGTIEEWFGYPASIDPIDGDPRTARAGTEKSRPAPIYRVLIMDGFNAHEKPVVLLYCEYFDIIAVNLPPMPRFQPLDIGLYKGLKAAQRGSLHRAMQQDHQPFSRRDFMEEFGPMYKEVFTTPQIQDAFRTAGLWPVDATKVIDTIKDEQVRLRQERKIPQFVAIEGSYYLTNAGRAETLVTDPILEMRLSLAHRWRSCRTDEDRWKAIKSSASMVAEVPDVADWIGEQPVEVRLLEMTRTYHDEDSDALDIDAGGDDEDIDARGTADDGAEDIEDENGHILAENDTLPLPDCDVDYTPPEPEVSY